ncbi:phenylalanine--tRNA ligase subunit beta [Candidatus Dependentiae bacterium]|nr:MAG: phenylalanine--tRNA ligase subunit beta [Candidatus Dependentiae bacterium]
MHYLVEIIRMKLSLNWIFQHLTRSTDTVDVQALIDLINQKVVEIDKVHTLSLDQSLFAFVQYKNGSFVHEPVPMQLKNRNDQITDCWYLATKKNNQWTWATVKDLGGTKENSIPALTLLHNDPIETFKKIVWHDYIIEISSSSITHRPDLWGHRGFAREIAALLNIPLKPITELASQVPIERIYGKKAKKAEQFPFTIDIQTDACSRFAATHIKHITNKPSIATTAFLLSRIDIRPINAVVDGTNLVMLDLGHPMHAFDSTAIENNSLTVCQNQQGITTVLDGQKIEVQKNDLIIKDSCKTLSLAGIMGCKESSVQATTSSLLIEAAVFDPTTIRTSATYHKKRTEASARFEKNLDPEQASWALKRYLWYAQEHELIKQLPVCIIDIGKDQVIQRITIDHQTIENLLGIPIDYRFVLNTLNALEYTVTFANDQYIVEPPSFRSSDSAIKEDIVEEIGRLYGYQHIKPQAPAITRKTTVDHTRSTNYALSSLLSFGLHMHEIKSYAFFDEQFLQKVNWPAMPTVEVHTPVSQNWKRLISTLIPGLLKAVIDNSMQQEKTAFFEVGSVWHPSNEKQVIKEQLQLGLIHAEDQYSFYNGKKIIHSISQVYGVDPLWIAYTPAECPSWLMPYKSAKLMLNQTCIGYAGMLSNSIQQHVGRQVPNSIFVAEIYIDAIAMQNKNITTFKPMSKFQPVTRDITIWTLKQHTAQTFINAIKSVNKLISSVAIVDFLEKEEWPDHRAITLRMVIESYEKTFTKEEIDLIVFAVSQKISSFKAEIR